jgi:hypothetical protein
MANVDRPNGYHPIGSLAGNSWNGLVRRIGEADSTDNFLFDIQELASGLATPFTVEDEALGVAVGFGKQSTLGSNNVGPFNPVALETVWYDDSANTHTDWHVFYVPAYGGIFDAQQDDTTDLVPGNALDTTVTGGSTTTGVSTMEINGDATSNDGDIVIVGPSLRVDNDSTDTWARWVCSFQNTDFAYAT